MCSAFYYAFNIEKIANDKNNCDYLFFGSFNFKIKYYYIHIYFDFYFNQLVIL